MWAGWLQNPCRLGVPNALKQGTKSESNHKLAKWLHSPCRLWVPKALERGTNSELAHKWTRGLHNTCRLGGHENFTTGGKIRVGREVGRVATEPLPPEGSATLQSGGTKSEVAHKWARRLHRHCRLGGYPTL